MPRITYLLSQYPTIGHTYLLREVTGLRALGWDVDVISIQRPVLPPESGSVEEVEAARTRYVNRPVAAFTAAGVVAMVRRPLGALRAFVRATALAPAMRELPRWWGHAVQAAITADMLVRRDTHVHAHFCMHLAVLLDAVRGDAGWSMSVHGPAEFDGPKAFLLPTVLARATWVRTISAIGRAICLMRAPEGTTPTVIVNRLGLVAGSVPSRAVAPPRAPGATVRLVTVGRLSVEKGLGVLLEAVRLTVDGGVDVSLRLIGGGPEEAALRRLAASLGLASRVDFAGWIQPSAIPDELARADVFVSSSFAEGIPLVLMEAMTVGVPCVATSVGGVAELVVHGETGLLVPPADASALASAIRTLAADPVLAGRLVLLARERLARDFDLTRN
nr:glycosyltransferase [Gemmatimonadaceae bacterium]